MKMKEYKRGLAAGIPIALGYLSVSFTFGIMCVSDGLFWWQSVLISMLTVTSAGQFAALEMIFTPGLYLTMLITQFTINIRYSFMSVSMAQKLDRKFDLISRLLFGFMITDEIFAVSVKEPKIHRVFLLGLCTLPYLGWTLGTLFGAVLGFLLPEAILTALGIAIYGMFIALVLPDAKASRPVLFVTVVAALMSCAFTYLPRLSDISSGLSISICAVAAAALGASFFPLPDEEQEKEAM